MNTRRKSVQCSLSLTAVLFVPFSLIPGCMLPMMGMHGTHGGEDKHGKSATPSSSGN
jgi:hypothetical protein